MSKLEDIGRNYAIVAPLIPPSEVQWLIQRVRQLETALKPFAVVGEMVKDYTNVQDAYLWTRNTEKGLAGGISVLHVLKAREALKES